MFEQKYLIIYEGFLACLSGSVVELLSCDLIMSPSGSTKPNL
jgi:hypothetical protein